MQATRVVLPDPKCDRCTFICGSSIRAWSYNNVHHEEAVAGTRSSSRADVQVDYLGVEMELQGVETDRQLLGPKYILRKG